MDESKWRAVGVAVLAVAVAAGALLGLGGRPEALPVVAVATTGVMGQSTPTSAELVIHVAGAVTRPGLVRVAPGSRVADAVDAAGGPTVEAALTAINLAAPLSDGMQVVVPSQVVGAGGEVVAGPIDDGLVHVNQASVSELDELPGVGPVLAERIAAYRDENGPFESVEDLLDVPGIGESKLDAMRDVIAIP